MGTFTKFFRSAEESKSRNVEAVAFSGLSTWRLISPVNSSLYDLDCRTSSRLDNSSKKMEGDNLLRVLGGGLYMTTTRKCPVDDVLSVTSRYSKEWK